MVQLDANRHAHPSCPCPPASVFRRDISPAPSLLTVNLDNGLALCVSISAYATAIQSRSDPLSCEIPTAPPFLRPGVKCTCKFECFAKWASRELQEPAQEQSRGLLLLWVSTVAGIDDVMRCSKFVLPSQDVNKSTMPIYPRSMLFPFSLFAISFKQHAIVYRQNARIRPQTQTTQ